MHSIRLRFMLLFLLLVTLLLLLLNTVPTVQTRQAVFYEKERSLNQRAAALSASLSGLERFSAEGVAEALAFLDLSDIDRVAVFDAQGAPLYDSGTGGAVTGDVQRALAGQVIFRSRYARGAFHSSVVTPVGDGGSLRGALLLQEEDEAHAVTLRAVQRHLLFLSCVVAALSLLSSAFFVQRITGRIRALLHSMRTVAGGDYHFRHTVRGQDELSTIGREFNRLTERLEANEEEHRRFIGDASHELKSPLAAIRLLSDSILGAPDMDPGLAREFVADIRSETLRLENLTNELLTLSRLDAQEGGGGANIDFGGAAEAALASLLPAAGEKHVTLRAAIKPDCTVFGKREDVEHILFNLIDNAIKYNVPGGSVLVAVSAEEGEVVLSVEDTGIGIPDGELTRIFDRFYRVDKARSRDAGGTGLGLSIVQGAVLALGGSIRVGHNTPRGTRFVVRLPRVRTEEYTA